MKSYSTKAPTYLQNIVLIFHSYKKKISRFIDKEIIFVEVETLNGGSLFMWRKYFGEKARIIGTDNNPDAKIWEEHGFEIFIGDQGVKKSVDEYFLNKNIWLHYVDYGCRLLIK